MLNLLWEKDLNIICETFNRSATNSKDLLLWQDLNGKKLIATSFLHKIDSVDQIVTFVASNVDRPYQFDLKSNIYGRLNERSLLFKAQIISMNKHLISIYLPDEVRILELRKYQRMNLGKNSAVYSKIERMEDDLLGKRIYNVRLLDISRSGASFIVKAGDRKYFKESELLKILNIGTMDMGTPLEASIVYTKEISYSEGAIQMSIAKLAIKFDHSFPERMYNSLLERIIK